MDENEIKKNIEDYVWDLLYQHDMSPGKNERNKERMNKIVERCMKDLQRHNCLLEILENDTQIKYFVRQTILYML